MGAIVCKGCEHNSKYMKLGSKEEDLMESETLLQQQHRRWPRRLTKFGRRLSPPKLFVLYDMEEFKEVEDHEGVRRLLLRIPEWVSQRPTGDGYIEYWYYFRRDGVPLTPSRQLYPAARARLPWPILRTASPEMLQNFAHVVNRIAHCQLLSVQLSTMDDTPYSRQEKTSLSTKPVLGRTKRFNRREQSMERSKPWRPMSLVKDAYCKVWSRNQGKA
ncbi:unnamed protein product [Calypogeia fissa]